MRYLFVCTGNTCRSPMAAALMNRELARRGCGQDAADSAGLMAVEGAPANEHAMSVMREYGIDLSAHAAKRLRRELIADDLVFCMDQRAAAYARSCFPQIQFYDICEFAGLPGEIADPYGMGPSAYRECAEKLFRCVSAIVSKTHDTDYYG